VQFGIRQIGGAEKDSARSVEPHQVAGSSFQRSREECRVPVYRGVGDGFEPNPVDREETGVLVEADVPDESCSISPTGIRSRSQAGLSGDQPQLLRRSGRAFDDSGRSADSSMIAP